MKVQLDSIAGTSKTFRCKKWLGADWNMAALVWDYDG